MTSENHAMTLLTTGEHETSYCTNDNGHVFTANAPDPSEFYERDLQARKEKEKPLFNSQMPALLDCATLIPELSKGAGAWLDEYIAFAQLESPSSPTSYHCNAALFALTAVSARRIFAYKSRPLYPAMNFINFGISSLFAKTEAKNIAEGLLTAADLSSLIFKSRPTPQKLFTNMILMVPPNFDELPEVEKERIKSNLIFRAQQGAFWEELGKRLRAMADGRSIYSQMYELILQLYDCPETLANDTHARGAEIIREPFLPIFGNGTPDNVRELASRDSQAWGDGLLPRMNIACPPIGAPVIYDPMPFHEREYPDALVKPLQNWHRRLGIPEVEVVNLNEGTEDKKPYYIVEHGGLPAHELKIPAKTQELYYSYRTALIKIIEQQTKNGHSFHLAPTYARLPDSALKVSMLLASLDDLGEILPVYFARGQKVAEMWREGAHNLTAHVEAAGDRPGKFSRRADEDKVITAVQKLAGEGEHPTIGRIRERTSLSYNEVKNLCRELVSNDILSEQEYKPPRGKKGTAYYWNNDNK